MRLLVVFAAMLVLSSCTPAARTALVSRPQGVSNEAQAPKAVLSRLPLYFIENRGQMDSRAPYYLQGSKTSVYFTPKGAIFALTGQSAMPQPKPEPEPQPKSSPPAPSGRWLVKQEFLGARPVAPVGEALTPAIVSYFKGPREQWKTGLPTYSRLSYRDLWPGIDLSYFGTGDKLEYQFDIAPGADPAMIRMAYRGATSVSFGPSAEIRVETPLGGFTDHAPVAYQQVGERRVPVEVAYAMDGDSYGFRLGTYDPALPMVIDPAVLVYAGFIGGSSTDFGTGITVDSSGNAYVAGLTYSSEVTFPDTVGPDLSYNDAGDAFVAKVSADGTGLSYAGYIGSSANDAGYAIAVDSSGNAYVAGSTYSSYNGNYDAFVAKVSADGTGLDYTTYIEGSDGNDYAYGVAVDSSGNAYVTGYTTSTSGIATGGAWDTSHNGSADAFVAKVNSTGASLSYAGYIGGSGIDYGYGIAVDDAGGAYVTGYTTSTQSTFPDGDGFGSVTGPDTTHNGSDDAFVAKVKPDGTGLMYAGYIGGSGGDIGYGIAVDSSGNAYVTGYTASNESTFPDGDGFGSVTGPDTTHNGGNDVFVAEVIATGASLVYAGYIGGSDGEIGLGIALDSSGNAYVTGYTLSSEATFPVTVGPDLTHNGGSVDAFVAKVSNPSPTAAGMERASARMVPGGVLIEWRTGFEADSLGFNLYREQGGGRIRINPELVAGSALLARATLSAGRSYSFLDQGGTQEATYFIEEVDLSGARNLHGPIVAAGSPGQTYATMRAPLLSSLGSPQGMPSQRTARLPSRPGSSQLSAAAALARSPALKLGVRETGWYRLSFADMAAAGLNVENPSLLQLHAEGKQQPLLITADGVEFYGLGLDTPATDTRVYWMLEGRLPGRGVRRLGLTGGLPVRQTGLPASSWFWDRVEQRYRTVYFSALTNGEEENFFGPVISPAPVELALSAPHLAFSGKATLEVALQGVTAGAHRVAVLLNGFTLGEVVFPGREQGRAAFSVSELEDGENMVRLSSAAPGDVSLVERLVLDYPRALVAEDNALGFVSRGRRRVRMRGFRSPGVRVVDVTNPLAVAELEVAITPEQGGYSASATLPAGRRTRRVYAFGPEQVKAPAWVALNKPSSLRSPDNGADLLIVSSARISPALAPLVEARRAQGLKVAVVDVEDVYDEFSFGEKSPEALRDLIAYARDAWATPPRSLLLAGDASIDPRGYLGGSPDLVPTRLIDTAFMEAPSDAWFTDSDGDGAPDIATGRLPAETAAQAAHLIEKILVFESSARSRSVLVASDEGFSHWAEKLAAELPPSFDLWELGRAEADSRGSLLDVLGAGPALVNYAGHGSVDLWRGGWLSSADAGALANTERPSVFVLMTCLNGYFADPVLASLGEALLLADGGAAAVWASSALTVPVPQMELNRAFYQLVFQDGLSVGQAAAQAAQACPDRDVRSTWTLLGDPTMRFP